jgi:hypothetical protein
MNKLILSAFIASSLFTSPALVTGAFAQSDCTADAPAAWFRPGGYCDTVKGGNSLSVPVDPGCETPYLKLKLATPGLQKGDSVDVAATCEYGYCTELLASVAKMTVGDRLRTALIFC